MTPLNAPENQPALAACLAILCDEAAKLSMDGRGMYHPIRGRGNIMGCWVWLHDEYATAAEVLRVPSEPESEYLSERFLSRLIRDDEANRRNKRRRDDRRRGDRSGS